MPNPNVLSFRLTSFSIHGFLQQISWILGSPLQLEFYPHSFMHHPLRSSGKRIYPAARCLFSQTFVWNHSRSLHQFIALAFSVPSKQALSG